MSQASIKKNTLYNAIKTLSSIIFPLITFPYISRVLLPENVGKINFAASIVSYFSLIASLGISTYAIRECSATRDDKDVLSNTASQIYSINVVTTIASYSALAFTLLFYSKLSEYRLLIIIQSLGIIAATLGTDWLNSAMEDFRYITIRTVVFQFVSLALMFIFVRCPEDYLKYAVISLISSAGANIVNIWYRRKYCRVVFLPHLKNDIDWKKHLRPIMLLFVMLLAQTIFSSVDATMLGLVHGDREVGIYSTASKISNIIQQLITSILWVIMPRMSYFFSKGDYEQINALLSKVLGFNTLLGLPCATGLLMLSDEIVYIAAGSKYGESSLVLKILVIGFVFTLFGGGFLGNCILLPSKKEKDFMIVCCIAAGVNVVSNYIFIPMFGAVAAAGTTSLCGFVIFIILLFRIDGRIRIREKLRIFISPIVGCAIIVLVCIVCKGIPIIWLRIAICTLVSSVLYFAVTYFGKNVLMREIADSIAKRLLRK